MLPVLEMPTLVGRFVRLETLSEEHISDLAAASMEDRATYGFAAVPNGKPAVESYVHKRIAERLSGEFIPFAQIRLEDGQAVGATMFLNLRRRPDGHSLYAVEIGGTWLAASAQRTGINLESKLLLLTHAFDTWRVARVDLKTDVRNIRARMAIERLGAQFEGVLRSWQPSQAVGEGGQLRDSAMYSVIATEWAATAHRLRRRLDGRQTEG